MASHDKSRPDPAAGPEHDLEKWGQLVDGQRTCVLTTISHDGELHARPMTVQGRDGNRLWMMAFADSPKIEHIAKTPEVNVMFSEKDAWVSTKGNAAVVDNPAKKKELWNSFAEAWFQCEVDDPAVVLLSIEVTGGEYWEKPNGVEQIMGVAQVLLFKKRPAEGENAKLDLA